MSLSFRGKAPAEIAQHLARAVVPWRARDAAPGVGAGAAEVQPPDRRAVVRAAEQRPRGKELIERERAVENISRGQPEFALEIGGGGGRGGGGAGPGAPRGRRAPPPRGATPLT